jgi:hypothetical protein
MHTPQLSLFLDHRTHKSTRYPQDLHKTFSSKQETHVDAPSGEQSHSSAAILSTAPIFEVRLNQNFVENLPRKNTTITTFHAVSKEGTGLFTDFPNFCYRVLFALSFPSTQNGDQSALCWDEWIKHLLQPHALGSLCGVRVDESIAACDCVTTVVLLCLRWSALPRAVTEERARWCGR